MALLNGQIIHMDPAVMHDIDLILDYVEEQNAGGADQLMTFCVSRVRQHLAAYRAATPEV